MFITQISPKYNYTNSFTNNKVSTFRGYKPNPEVLRNQYKILLTQDIWAEKLAVKMPETPIEKEVLLEILTQRKKLDRFTRLTNEKARIKFNLEYLSFLSQNEPNSPKIVELKQELSKKGNLISTVGTLDKNIELEASKNRQAIEYFDNINRLEEEYEATHNIKTNTMSKFWAQIRKNNINKDNKFSTQELIDIVSEDKNLTSEQKVEVVKPVIADLSKKQILACMKRDYEQHLRENINVYTDENMCWLQAQIGMDKVKETYKDAIRKFPGIEKQFKGLFDEVHKMYQFKTGTLHQINVFNVGVMWKEMNKGIKEMQEKTKLIQDLQKQIAENEKDDVAKVGLTMAEQDLSDIKKTWTKALVLSDNCEKKNRSIFEKAGKGDIYSYLTDEHKDIKKYRNWAKICNENNGVLPEEVWSEILTSMP